MGRTCYLGGMWRRAGIALTLVLAGWLAGCSDEPPTPSLRMDFADSLGAEADLYAAPWPSDHRLNAAGAIDLTAFPNPFGQPIVSKLLEVLDGRVRGFGTTSVIYLTAAVALDPATLPGFADSVGDAASVFLIALDPDSPAYLVKHPIEVRFVADGGPYGASNTLAALPLQGVPLRPSTRYALVVTRAVRTASGAPLGRSAALDTLIAGGTPRGLGEAGQETYRAAVSALGESGALEQAVALAAFTTDDPTVELLGLSEHAHGLDTPAPLSPLAPAEIFDDFCVFEGELDMPVYQAGEPPFSEAGGGIVFTKDGPVLDHLERARIVVTLPRAPMPSGGWPTVVMIRTGGGGDRPLVDRGVRDESGEPVEAGSGPARDFARVGFAGVSVDGPHGGIRNVSGGDEQFLMFNFTNPIAMRDNVRQSALEIGLVPELLDALQIDAASCPGTTPTASFDGDKLALFGHSMGATIAPLALAANPRYGAVILSGAGGSWIENVVYKQSPIAVRPFADVLVGYTGTEHTLTEHDPVLTLLQWAGEPADPPVYGRALVPEAAAPRHVLMLQGIVDTYILPPIANAMSLSLGLDLGGDELDRGHAELEHFLPLSDVLPFVGRAVRSLPIEENHGAATAVVVQHEEDGVEDGHEIAFQREEPKAQYRCFLASWLGGAPRVLAPTASCD